MIKRYLKITTILFIFIGYVLTTSSCKKNRDAIPTLGTLDVLAIFPTSAVSVCYISEDAGVINCGVCWSTSQNPTIVPNKTLDYYKIPDFLVYYINWGTPNSTFTSHITGLTANTTYYIRAYATNNSGTGYGQQIQFTTPLDITGEAGTIIDIDGNTYSTIGIGGQRWMAEDLKTTKFNDGTYIPLVPDSLKWGLLTTPGYCWYNNDSTYKKTYGALYNGYSIQTGKLCPTGWHIPAIKEWFTLAYYLGGEFETGFAALPEGCRFSIGRFLFLGDRSIWWGSESTQDIYSLSYCYLRNSSIAIDYFHDNDEKKSGYSVRCLKDN
jgi:hypothetical protein